MAKEVTHAPSIVVADYPGFSADPLPYPRLVSAAPTGAGLRVPSGRAKLSALPPLYFCSILGTCFTTTELRKLIGRLLGVPASGLSDLEVHERAVELAGRSDAGARELHRALESKYQQTVRQFETAKTQEDLSLLWEEAKKSGAIPGAYWAVLTHRRRTPELSQRVFGDVHMLSHLVGAANRADIQRLVALQRENAELAEKVERQQDRLRDSITSRDERIRRLSEQLAAQTAEPCTARASDPEAVQTLSELVASLQERLAAQSARHERATRRLEETQGLLTQAQRALRAARAAETALRAEVDALEAELVPGKGTAVTPSEQDLRSVLQGRRIVYVGGRPAQVAAIRSFVERLDAHLLHHDGGLEDRNGMLRGLISRADVVVFPVDCVSHDAAGSLKRICQQADKPFHPLRTASIASFVTALRGDAVRQRPGEPPLEGPASRSVPPPSRFCLRHG